MRKLFAILLSLPLFAFANDAVPAMAQQAITATEEGLRNIAILNRPLVKVNGKTISQMDVIKKMNAFLYRNYPDVIGDKVSMYQYYSSSWRRTLDELINDELMLLEAEAKEITVTVGDVREEVEARFGPNVMANLEKIGMNLEEARSFIETEMLVQRVMWMNVHQKAMQDTTPKKIKEAYTEFVKANPPKDIWTYQVLAVRSNDQELAKRAIDLAASCGTDLEAGLEKAENAFAEEPETPTISLSDDYSIEATKLSDQHKRALNDLEAGKVSAPIEQTSRDGSTVWRLFLLKDKQHLEAPPFTQVSEQIKNQIMQRYAMEYATAYFKELRDKYHLGDDDLAKMIPEDYEPFALR